ncbi:unnamed protein product [Leptidea sinapis]|uniref:Uncharacterized protein n=1 Tax=Leptidea sinapis TaxID=189913 RepID=A0A5E4PNM0_9NEOP|nr:unnamed protein product [Leptidea sinapis]
MVETDPGPKKPHNCDVRSDQQLNGQDSKSAELAVKPPLHSPTKFDPEKGDMAASTISYSPCVVSSAHPRRWTSSLCRSSSPRHRLVEQYHLHRHDGGGVRMGLSGGLTGSKAGAHRHLHHQRPCNRRFLLQSKLRAFHTRRFRSCHLVILRGVSAKKEKRCYVEFYGRILDSWQLVRGRISLGYHS